VKFFKSNFLKKRVAPRKGGHYFLPCLLIASVIALASPLRAQVQQPIPEAWLRANEQMALKNPAAALPYLEELVRSYPDVALYRLELAYALYLLGRDGRAQYHFIQARGAQLSDEQRRAVDTTLARIAARKTVSFRLGFGLEPSTNAGKGTAAGSVDVGGLILPVPDALREKSATGAVISAGVTYRPRLAENLEASFSFDTLIRYYEDAALRETQILARAGLRYSPGANKFIEGGALIGTTHAAGSPYNKRYGAYGNYSTLLGERAFVRFGAERYRMRHDTFPVADGMRTQLDAQFSYALASNTLMHARGYVLHTDASSAVQSGVQGALSLGGTYAFKGGLVAGVDLTAGLDRRDGINALTGTRRSDRSIALDAQVYNSKIQIGPFSPVLRLKFEKNRSNQTLNSYSNRSVSFGLRTSF